MLPVVPEAADTLMAYGLTHQALQQFIVNTHTEWFNTIDNSISKQLQNNLLTQDKADREWLSACARGLQLVPQGTAVGILYQPVCEAPSALCTVGLGVLSLAFLS